MSQMYMPQITVAGYLITLLKLEVVLFTIKQNKTTKTVSRCGVTQPLAHTLNLFDWNTETPLVHTFNSFVEGSSHV